MRNQPVYWYEGMFLRPQHFQAAERYWTEVNDVSEQLDVIPAVIQVKRFRRPRYGCRSCESAVVQAKAPPRLVENGMATTALVTSIVVGRFAWHLPLNRQTHMLRGHGIGLDRSTLVHWVLRAAWWLKRCRRSTPVLRRRSTPC